MTAIRKRRGRPLNASRPAIAKQDEAIGRTVWQLCAWGYTRRSSQHREGAAEVVGRLAREVLGRHAPEGGSLGPDAVEVIFKRWLSTQTMANGWRARNSPGPAPLGRPWDRFTVDWLRGESPGGGSMPLHDAARRLLETGGHPWPGAAPASWVLGDPEYTASVRKDWATMPRIVGMRGLGEGE